MQCAARPRGDSIPRQVSTVRTMCLQVRRDGGLFVIGTYLFESQRVEHQLMGRAGRQVN